MSKHDDGNCFTSCSLPPSFRTPGFQTADAEAASFLRFCRPRFLTCAELMRRASKLSPDARRIVRWAMTELGAAQRSIDRRRADALLHRTMHELRSGHG
jgi:hypothetical protein